MERREFIKLSSLVAAWFATPKGISSLANPNPIEGESILIYKMVHHEKGIQVRATAYANWIGNRRKSSKGWKQRVIDPKKYDISTFEILEEVPAEKANETKWKYWQELGCKGQYVPYEKDFFITTGASAKESPRYQAWLKSPEWKEHFREMCLAGGRAAKKTLKANWGSCKEHMKYVRSKMTPEQKAIQRAKLIHMSKTLPRTEKQIQATREMGKKWGKINGGSNFLSFTPEQKKKYASMGGRGGGGAKQIAQGNHNFLTQSPNNIRVICPDGFITSRPSSVVYCRNRGLNPADCRVLQIQAN
jgi:hypothetical protein